MTEEEKAAEKADTVILLLNNTMKQMTGLVKLAEGLTIENTELTSKCFKLQAECDDLKKKLHEALTR